MISEESILIVDDELAVRESLRMILKPLYKLEIASNGREALRIIRDRNNKIDLITLDLKMPGLSGIDVLREIRTIDKEIGIIIVTAFGSLDNAKETVRYGVTDFITKPFNTAEIIFVINRFFEKQREKVKIKKLTQQIDKISEKGSST